MASGIDEKSICGCPITCSPIGKASDQAAARTAALPHNVKDAISFLIKWKDIFRDTPGKYTELLSTLDALKDQRTNLAGFSARVKELIKDHPELIPDFNCFLPKGYEIFLSPEEELADYVKVSCRLVNKVHARFKHDGDTINRFNGIFYQIFMSNMSGDEAIEDFTILFQDHQDLLEELSSFVLRKLAKKRGIDLDIEQGKFGLQDDVQYAYNTLQRLADQSLGSPSSCTVNDALYYVEKLKASFQDKKETYHELIGTLLDFKNHKITLARLVATWQELLKDNCNLILGFSTFLPEGYKIMPSGKSAEMLQSFASNSTWKYANKIVARLPNNERIALIRIIDEYLSARKSGNEAFKDATVLLKDHQDLFEGLTGFLPHAIQVKPPWSRNDTTI